jgi:uncharacterized protein YijF (DUF1287 family)
VAFYKQEFGLELRHYFEGKKPEDKEVIKNLIYTHAGDFKKVDVPIYGDIVLIKIEGVESHIGIYIDEQFILHSRVATGSVMDRLHTWKHRVTGYYRATI